LILRSAAASNHNYFHTSLPTFDEENAAVAAESAESAAAAAAVAKSAAAEYNLRKASYNQQVSSLRKKYASEAALQRAADEAELAAREKEERRRTLERHRLKKIKSAQNSIRQLEMRRAREMEFNEELRVAQVNRDARNELYRKARQLVVDKLEEEAPLWLTTHEEVDKVFTHEVQQELWSFPNSVVGAPTPTEDAKYWNMESHTWHLDMTYRTQEEALTEQILEEVYTSTNIDENYWTPERLQEREELEDKAKLRAMVKDAGRRHLLTKQKELLQDTLPREGSVDVPRPMPVPNVRVLANEEVMEKEGAQALFKDPTQFFEFDNHQSSSLEDSSTKRTNNEDGSYEGPTLGAPISLRNDVMVEKRLNLPYPDILGRLPPPDKRTAKEKKRAEREHAMMLATRENFDPLEIDDDHPLLNVVPGDEPNKEELEWAEGFDPEKDQELINTPERDRFTEKDVDLIVAKLERKEKFLTDQINTELRSVQAKFKSGITLMGMDSKEEEDTTTTDKDKETYMIVTENGKRHDAESLGVNQNELNILLESLTEEQMVALVAIDHESNNEKLSPSELEEKLKEGVPGLTTEQIDSFIRIETTLSSSDVFEEEEDDMSKFDLKNIK